MLRDIIGHFRRWNTWRKYSDHNFYYKLLVLIGIKHSSSMYSAIFGDCLQCEYWPMSYKIPCIGCYKKGFYMHFEPRTGEPAWCNTCKHHSKDKDICDKCEYMKYWKAKEESTNEDNYC